MVDAFDAWFETDEAALELQRTTQTAAQSTDLQVVEYVGAISPQRAGSWDGINRMVSLRNTVIADPAARTIVRAVIDVRADNDASRNRSDEIATYLDGLPDTLSVIVLVRA